MIRGILSSQILDEWEKIEPFFQNFAKRSQGRDTVDSILRDVLNRDRQVWSVNDYQALVVTSIYPDSVNIIAVSGERRKEWQDEVLDEMQKWATSLGKKYVISMARPGWDKFFKSKSYREIHREYMIEV